MTDQKQGPMNAEELEHAAHLLPGAIDNRASCVENADLDAADWAEGYGYRLLATIADLESWRTGKKGVEDYYEVREQLRQANVKVETLSSSERGEGWGMYFAEKAEKARMRRDLDAKDHEVATLREDRGEIREAMRNMQAEIADLSERIREDNAFCICGCPVDEHENLGEDGEACENQHHECFRVCAAAVSYVQRVTARSSAGKDGTIAGLREQLRTKDEALHKIVKTALTVSAHSAITFIRDYAESALAPVAQPEKEEGFREILNQIPHGADAHVPGDYPTHCAVCNERMPCDWRVIADIAREALKPSTAPEPATCPCACHDEYPDGFPCGHCRETHCGAPTSRWSMQFGARPCFHRLIPCPSHPEGR